MTYQDRTLPNYTHAQGGLVSGDSLVASLVWFTFVLRSLVKNMLMTYFNTTESKRADVVRVIGSLLGFTHEELEKVCL